MTGGPVTLAAMIAAEVAAHGQPDAVVVSGLTDLGSLLGLARRAIGLVPAALYLHENQVTHPKSPRGGIDDAAALATWRSINAADLVICNSAFHRDDLRYGLRRLLARSTTPAHDHLIEPAMDAAVVVPVGIEVEEIPLRRSHDVDRPTVIYNQRWAWDKRPGHVVGALRHAAAAGRQFDVVLAGETESDDRLFCAAVGDLGARVIHAGYADRRRYCELLGEADIVIGAALHEFCGVSVLEALAAGCIPVLPDRLAYPEVVDRPGVLYEEGKLIPRLLDVLDRPEETRSEVEGLAERIRENFAWSKVADRLDQHMADLVSAYGDRR
jgi:glycosyltransferase involved in cell wall biosynthesis